MTVRTIDGLGCAVEGTNETFARVLAEHRAAIRRVANTYARNEAEAADLAQDVAIALWRALPSFRGESSLRTFVFRIAHNRGVSFAQARAATGSHSPIEDDTSLVDPAPAGDEILLGKERREALLTAIRALPLGARTVLTLALEGLSHDEIAHVVGSTANSVAVRLNDARARVREHVRRHHGS